MKEKLNWSTDNLPSLGRTFLRNVLKNMRKREDAYVRFGLKGEGIRPNYQVFYPNGYIRAINGASHTDFVGTDKFNEDNISQKFYLKDIEYALGKA